MVGEFISEPWYVGQCQPEAYGPSLGDPLVIKISGECAMNGRLEQIAADVASISSKGFNPVLLFGWGKPLNDLLREKGIRSVFTKEGNRITDHETMDAILGYVPEAYEAAHRALENAGIESLHTTFYPVFHAEQLDPSLGQVGSVEWVDIFPVKAAIDSGKVPVVYPVGFSEFKKYNINADTAAAALVLALKPWAYLAITGAGGILGKDSGILPEVSIEQDYAQLVETGIVSGGMLKKLDEAAQLVGSLNHGFHVRIIGPGDLAKAVLGQEKVGTTVCA